MPDPPLVDSNEPTGGAPDDTHHHRSARQIFLRGLAITLPSILTVVIVLWFGRLVYDYVIDPVSTLAQFVAAEFIDQSRDHSELVSFEGLPPLDFVGRRYALTEAKRKELVNLRQGAVAKGRLTPDEVVPWRWIAGDDERFRGVYFVLGDRAVPYRDYAQVAEALPPAQMPETATGIYMELLTIRYSGSTFLLSTLAVLIALLAIYFVGRLVRIRIGAYLVSKFEDDILGRLPVISNVYGSVKQVTDFVLSERKIEYNRVVALEYPRRGIWSMGFVTGEGMRQVVEAAGEPLINVLVPTSPMPVTGYTMSVPRSHVIDLDISVDQAFQFAISCGVLIPPGQLPVRERREFVRAAAERQLVESSSGQRPAPTAATSPSSSAPPVAADPRNGGRGTPPCTSPCPR